MKIRGAIFDFDGTLLDSMPMWFSVCEDYLTQNGLQVQGISQEFRTMSLEQSAAYIRDFFHLDKSAEQIFSEINAMVEHRYHETLPLKEGAWELVRDLKAQGVKLALATASGKHLLDPALKRLHLSEMFDGVFTCAELNTSKSETKIFETALSALGTSAEETWVFEDSLLAIRAAKAVGLKTATVADPTNEDTVEEMQRLSDTYVDTFPTWEKAHLREGEIV